MRHDIPIILSTGHSDAVSPERAKEAGIKEFLMKPIEKRTLAEAIRRILNKADSDSI
jgi:FixJ family two-component response regulator